MMIKLLAIAATALVLAGCKDPNNNSIDQNTSNPSYSVRKLFTNEGCTAYRFYDDGRYRYYVVCDADKQVTVNSGYSEMVGKVSHYRNDEISTIMR